MSGLIRNLAILVCGSCFLMCALGSFAQAKPVEEKRKVPQPIQEVFQSDLVYPQDEDEIQFTFFPSYRKQGRADKARTLVEIEYGITDAFQVIAEWDGLLYENPEKGPTISSPGNLELGAQYSWMALGDGNLHASLGAFVEFPTGSVDDGLTEGFLEWKPFVVLARDFPQWNQSQIFLEFGFNWVDRMRPPPDDPEPEIDSLFWNVGGFLPIGPWRGVLEINVNNNQLDGGGVNEIFLTPGVIYKLSKEWEIGLAAPVGLTDTSDDYRLVGYIMWEFELDELEEN